MSIVAPRLLLLDSAQAIYRHCTTVCREALAHFNTLSSILRREYCETGELYVIVAVINHPNRVLWD